MFKNPFSFEGRIRRTEYGITFIIYIIMYVVQTAIIASSGAGALIGFLIIVPLLWFVWAQGAKRCHDVGRSGWFQIIPLYFFVLLFQEGEAGINSYGANPKDPNARQYIELDSETLDGHLRRE